MKTYHRRSRWAVLAMVMALALVAGACAPAAEPPSPDEGVSPTPVEPAPAAEVPLAFDVWSYGVETILDNISLFEEANPGVTVALRDQSWFDYHDLMAAKFTTGDAPDVAYSSDHWLRQWVAAGWIAPLDEHLPHLAAYQDEWAPYALEGMMLDGNLYGLPYYADLLIFIYNDRVAQEAGFQAPAATLEELKEQAEAIKAQGLSEFPVNIPLKKDDPWTIETFYSLVYGQGGSMFDENLEPVFNQAGSEAEQVLQWLYDAVNTWRIMDPVALEVAEPDVVKTMGAGQHIYTVLAKYNLAELNLGVHDETGNFRMALMPGPANSTVGFVRFYALSQNAVDRGPDAVEAAGRFLEYFGGKTDGEYKVVKRWALEFGLGFANLPLYDDPEVAEAINAWGNVDLERQQAELARVKEGLTPWWGTWDVFAREQIHAAVLGTATPQEALESMASRWETLRQEFEG